MANNFNESKLRARQAAKTASELMHCLENMGDVSRQNVKNDFISPIEMVRKNAHWNEFATSARRIIFSLKTELFYISHDLAPDVKLETQGIGNSFRFLLSASKKCIQLLKGLSKFPNEIKYGKRGYKLKEEVVCVARKLILFMSLFGILPANIDFKKLSKNRKKNSREKDLPLSDDDTDTSINISTSDLDSDAANVLDSENVRHKLSNLAERHLAKNKKHKKGKISFKTIQPMKKIPKPYLGVTEDLADGRRIQFIHDSLSHKLRRKNTSIGYIYHGQHKQKKTNPSLKTKEDEYHPNLQLSVPRYGASEMAADMVFERLLPHLQAKKALDESSNICVGDVDWNIFRIKLKNLSERLVAVEKANNIREKYAKHLEQLISSWNESEVGFMDLSESIKYANKALQKVSEVNYNYSYHNYSTDAEQSNKYLYSEDHAVPKLGREVHDTFYGNLNFPSIQEELQAKRNEFWNSLVENNYITLPTTSNINGLPILPTNEQEDINNSKGLVNEYGKNYDKVSIQTQIMDSLSSEIGESSQETSPPVRVTIQGNEEDVDMANKELLVEEKGKNTTLGTDENFSHIEHSLQENCESYS